jgi:hypothetical protein
LLSLKIAPLPVIAAVIELSAVVVVVVIAIVITRTVVVEAEAAVVPAMEPPLWSSDQSSWLQIQRSGFDSWRYQIL